MKKRTVPILLASLLLVAHSGLAQSTAAPGRNLIMTDGTADVSGQNDSAKISIAIITEGESLVPAASKNDAKTKESLENEALKQAVQQAVQRAKTMAEAAGVKLRRIVSLSTQPIQIPPQPHLLRAVEMKAEADAAAPPMEIGESRIRVQVGIIYEIEP